MGVLDKFMSESNNYYSQNKVEMVKIVPQNMMMFNKSVVISSIYNIDKMSDNELREFIHCSFDSIMNLDNEITLKCFTNIRFLNAITDVVSRSLSMGKYFPMLAIIKINSICYDYLTLQNKDSAIANRLYSLSSLINSTKIPRLLGLGLSSKLANILLIARYSSIDPAVHVKRVDFIIIQNYETIKQVETIEKILTILYDLDQNQNNFILVFENIMFDILGEYSEDDPMTHWITDEIEEADSMLSLAILNILNNFTTAARREVLFNYSYSAYKNQIRFSMRTLSDDYANIKATCNYLKEVEGVSIP